MVLVLIVCAGCLLLISGLMIFPSEALEAARKGLDLWFGIVFPSLFPFLVATNILNASGYFKKAGALLEPVMRPLFRVPGAGSFALLLGTVSGYPSGAIVASEMRKSDLLNRDEADRLIAFSNNSGPVFLTGAVGAGMFNMPRIGLVLLVCHILAGLTVGLILRFRPGSKKSYAKNKYVISLSKHHTQEKSIPTILGQSVSSSLQTIIAIGGYIVIFSVIVRLLIESGAIRLIASLFCAITGYIGIPVPRQIFEGLTGGFFEITTGISMVSSSSADIGVKVAATGLIAGWGGLSVHSQVLGIISGTGISIKKYMKGKFLHGIIACIYTAILFKLCSVWILDTAETFLNADSFSRIDYLYYFLYSTVMAIVFIIFSSIAGVAARLHHKT